MRAALVALDDERAEAFVQVGTNVRLAGLAAAAEWWLGKPVVHVNTAMVWDILRAHDISHTPAGFGVLLEQH